MSDQTNAYTVNDVAAVEAKIEKLGGPVINLGQTSGTATADGVTIGWTLSGTTVRITIVSKPWYMPYGAIWDHINTVLQ
jgi:hypothetical protein